jgi:small multidrug resistance pump
LSWLLLIGAILLEVTGTTCMKLSQGFTRLIPVILMFIFYLLAIALLAIVLKKIEVGIAYAVWSGVGTALIATIGIVFFREQITLMKMGGILLIITGSVILNLTSGVH